MRFAYADPPYLGCGRLYKNEHPEAKQWDDPKTHRELISRLSFEFEDGWVLSLSSPSLRTILPMCPDDCRVGAWVKPFASFKPGVGVAYAWEPVIWRGGRKIPRTDPTIRDWVSANIMLERGLVGAKPAAFCKWILDLLGVEEEDEIVDLYPGTGILTETRERYRHARARNLELTFDLE